MSNSPGLDLSYRLAVPADAPRVLAIVQEAARWLESRGIPQWRWYLTQAGQDSISQRIAAAETYLVLCGDEDAATFTLQWTDRYFWGDLGEDGQAGYVHGLAVRRTFASRGVGSDMLAWSERQIAARGRRFLRLDCMAANDRLCGLYRQNGFSDAGVGTTADGIYTFQRFERAIAPAS